MNLIRLSHRSLLALTLAAAMMSAMAPVVRAQAISQLLGLDAPGQRNTVRESTTTEAEGATQAPTAIGAPSRRQPNQPLPPSSVSSANSLQPFGASLFTGVHEPSSDGPNPGHVLAPGDQITVRLWGAAEANVAGPVDLDGNVFLPGIGPVHVAGVRAGELQRYIEQHVQAVYPNNVNSYATILTANRIGVLVGGFVIQPGRHLGAASDSVLDFLVRAGGVDPTRGSYRDITIQRAGRTIARIDLYRFLLAGQLPRVQFGEGDTIVVGRQHGMVAADGAVRNGFLFEVGDRAMSGAELIELARPLPSVTHAIVAGSRARQPFSCYLSLTELRTSTFLDQDRVSLVAGVPASTVTVTVEGSRIGPSVLVVSPNARLPDVLEHIAVDPVLAQPRDISLLRRSVAAQQRRAISEALDRLEKSLYLSTSWTEGEANIRANEAKMVAAFIAHARQATPEGRLVVTDATGHVADVRMEDGDVILIPEKSQTVMVAGEVMVPQPVLWQKDWGWKQYVERAGGLTGRADRSHLLIRHANGELALDGNTALRPGDELIVLPEIQTKYMQLTKDVFQVIYQLALAVRVFSF